MIVLKRDSGEAYSIKHISWTCYCLDIVA